jgi:hypothetical protein
MKELTDILESIRDGVTPCNEREAFSWVETAKHLANTALIINNKKTDLEKITDLLTSLGVEWNTCSEEKIQLFIGDGKWSDENQTVLYFDYNGEINNDY